MSGSSKAKVLVAIFAASLLVQTMNTFSLLIAGVMAAYPGTGVTQAQLIISIGNLIGMVGMLIAGKMVNATTKKNVLLLMMGLMVIGALLGYFATPSLTMLYVACAVFGCGNGGLIPLTSGLIAEHFAGSTRATVMGVQGIFVNGGGMIFQLVGGFAVAAYWKNLFLVFLATIVIMLIVVILLPKGTVEKEEQVEGQAAVKPKVFTKFLVILMIQGFFIGLCFMTYMANITLDVIGLGIGDESIAGIINTIFSIGAIITGVCIALIMKGLKRYIFFGGMLAGAIGLWVCAFAGSMVTLAIGAFLVGAAFTMHNTSYYTIAPANASPSAMTMTMSLYTVAMQIGIVLCPMIITPLAATMGAGSSYAFLLGAIITTVVAVVAFITPRLMKDSKLTIQ